MPRFEALRMATGDAGELLALSVERSPYPSRLGVIEPGALADLLVVEGLPEDDLAWLATPDESMPLI